MTLLLLFPVSNRLYPFVSSMPWRISLFLLFSNFFFFFTCCGCYSFPCVLFYGITEFNVMAPQKFILVLILSFFLWVVYEILQLWCNWEQNSQSSLLLFSKQIAHFLVLRRNPCRQDAAADTILFPLVVESLSVVLSQNQKAFAFLGMQTNHVNCLILYIKKKGGAQNFIWVLW